MRQHKMVANDGRIGMNDGIWVVAGTAGAPLPATMQGYLP